MHRTERGGEESGNVGGWGEVPCGELASISGLVVSVLRDERMIYSVGCEV